MVVVMKQDATDADIEAVAEKRARRRRRGVRLARHRAHGGRAGRRHRAPARPSTGARCTASTT